LKKTTLLDAVLNLENYTKSAYSVNV